MGFLDIFKFKKTAETAPRGNMQPRRFHARYQLGNPHLCLMEHARFGLFSIVDLSYHGCLVAPVGDATFGDCKYPGLVEISLGGSSLRMEVAQCQPRKQGWGMVFKHSNESSIRSIGTYIEPLRCGNSAISLATAPSRDGAQSRFRRRYQGDGPFDLMVEQNEAGEIIFIMATVRRGSEYGCVMWDDGTLVTKKTMDAEGVGARMAQTAEVDKALVWVSLVTCLGLKFPDGPLCAEKLDKWLKSNEALIPMQKSS